MKVSLETIKKVCDIYNNGILNPKAISSITGFHVATISRALNEGKKLGICRYIPNIQGKSFLGSRFEKQDTKPKKKVKCINNGIIYDSIRDAAFYNHCSDDRVVDCCNGLCKGTRDRYSKELMMFE